MSFEDVMMKRLAKCHAEACDEIEEYLKAGVPLSDAVSYTIKELPASKTRDLRRWLKDWEAWEEWQKFQKQGWRVKKAGNAVYAYSPAQPHGVEHLRDGPSNAAVAAGAGVTGVKYMGDSTGHGNWTRPAGWKYDNDWNRLITHFVVARDSRGRPTGSYG